jgi:hypothetical protein
MAEEKEVGICSVCGNQVGSVLTQAGAVLPDGTKATLHFIVTDEEGKKVHLCPMCLLVLYGGCIMTYWENLGDMEKQMAEIFHGVETTTQ